MNQRKMLPFALGLASLASVAVPTTALAQGHVGGGGHGGGGGGHGGGGGFHEGSGGGFRGGAGNVHGGANPGGGFHEGGRPGEPGLHGGGGVRVGPGFHGEHFGGDRVHIIGPGVGWDRPHWGNGFWGWRDNSWVWLASPYWVTPDYPGWVWIGAQWVWDGQQWVWQDGYWAPAN
jgi:hypothetical protein